MVEQLGLISAVLGGFAFTFLGAILAKDDKRMIVDSTFVVGLVSALIFFICALGWSLISKEFTKEIESISQLILDKHRLLSKLFITGIFTLSVCLGMSGWIRSKKLGLITSSLSLIGMIIIFFIVKDFIE